jgi:aconitate hydratase
MGVLPLEFLPGESRASLGLTGSEVYAIEGLSQGLASRQQLTVRARGEDGSQSAFQAVVRIDTPLELEQYRHGGILPFILRRLLK